jgi:hypothetical protein
MYMLVVAASRARLSTPRPKTKAAAMPKQDNSLIAQTD